MFVLSITFAAWELFIYNMLIERHRKSRAHGQQGIAAGPYVLTARLSGTVLVHHSVPVILPNHVGLLLAGGRLCTHAEPKVIPVTGASTHGAVAVDGVELAAERVAGPGLVEGLAA